MKIDKIAGDIPKDSTINLRPRSVLGLKYVELNRGRSKDMLEDGETIPADQVSYPVDLDDYNRMFDQKTRGRCRRTSRASATRSPAAARR